MNVLDQLVYELQTAEGPVRMGELARRLGVQRSALAGMLEVLERKSVLVRPIDDGPDGGFACGGACGAKCAGIGACTFVANVGVDYPVVLDAQRR